MLSHIYLSETHRIRSKQPHLLINCKRDKLRPDLQMNPSKFFLMRIVTFYLLIVTFILRKIKAKTRDSCGWPQDRMGTPKVFTLSYLSYQTNFWVLQDILASNYPQESWSMDFHNFSGYNLKNLVNNRKWTYVVKMNWKHGNSLLSTQQQKSPCSAGQYRL